MCLGFSLPDNFRFPYAAIGFSDFWRRWHISLSSWLRDYLYIPLGGNRRGELRTYVNLSLTMLLGGLWHGASWTFVVWGALHGVFLMTERIVVGTKISRLGVWKTFLGKQMLMLGTFVAVCVTWVFFRADGFEEAFTIVSSMFGFGPAVPAVFGKFELLRAMAPTGCVVLAHWWLRDRTLEGVAAKCPTWLLAIVLATMIVSILMMPGGEDSAFIYFQF